LSKINKFLFLLLGIISPRFNPSRNSQREEIKNLKKTKNVNPEEDDLGPPPLPPLRETEFFRTRFKTRYKN